MSSATTAKIAARDGKNTGITPTVAKELYAKLGTSRIAIVELTSTEHTIDIEGKQSVKLEISYVEPVESGEIEDYLRDLSRALYRARNPQEAIDTISDQEPTAKDLLQRGRGLFKAGSDIADHLEDVNA